MQLSDEPFKTDALNNLEERLSIRDDIISSEESSEEEKIDWHAYLQEGSEKYRLPSEDFDEVRVHSKLDSLMCTRF